MRTEYPDYFVTSFEISLNKLDFNRTHAINKNSLLIIMNERDLTQDDFNLEDFGNKIIAKYAITITSRPNYYMAINELEETDKIIGYTLFNPDTREKFWISHYDLDHLLNVIELTKEIEPKDKRVDDEEVAF